MKKVIPVQQIYQPNGYTCGTASLYMASLSKNIKTPTLLELAEIMGTNPRTGTTDIEMSNGLAYLGLDVKRYAISRDNKLYQQSPECTPDNAFDALQYSIERDELFLLRTKMYGMLHWVLVNGIIDNSVLIACSATGTRTISKEQLFEFWSARDFDGFRV